MVESTLALPILLFILLGLAQLAWGLWARLLVQHAAHCAARAYTVWEPEDKESARSHAQKAATMALRPAQGLQSLSMSITAEGASPMGRSLMEPRQAYQQTHRLKLDVLLKPPLPGLLWRQGLQVQAQARILAEPAGEK